jgi:tetratricopeptide (TPR) repeat protein
VYYVSHIGLNTGEVIAAHVGDARQHGEDTAMGRAIALADRMEKAAEPGTVLVSEHTYRLVAPLFEWQALDQITVKGFSQPVAVYRPLAHRAGSGKARGIAGLESPLVGRDAEFQALQDAVERLRAGMGGIVTVVGEAGIGKSRLVAEVRRTADRRPQMDDRRPTADGGLAWVEGRCLSYATTVAYSLWLDLLRGLLDVAPDASPLAIRDALRAWLHTLCPDCLDDVYPFLGRLLSLPLEEQAEARLRGLDAEGLKTLTFRAAETLVERAAQRQPLVVVCEDLHWADSVSLELLGRLLPLTESARLLLLCVFRPRREHACWGIREAVARDYPHRHTDLWLEPLSATESVVLVGNLLHVEDLPDALRARILARAEGNPFFVEEILRALLDQGTIARDAQTGRWRATRDVADIPIPNTVHGVIAARIDRLPEETRRVLQQASVLGRIFTYPLLAAIDSPLPQEGEPPPLRYGEASRRSGVRGNALDTHLLTLQRAQLIRERARLPEREYVFKHVLTEEAAYNNLLKRERRAVHRRAAEALERLYPDRIEEQLGLLAHHWERAGETERAVRYLQRAGEQAASQYANQEAVGHFGRALDLVPGAEMELRYVLTLARERVYDLCGDREAQEQDLNDLRAMVSALADDHRSAEVALREANYALLVSGDRSTIIAAVQRAIHHARLAGDVAGEAEGYLLWGKTYYLRSSQVLDAIPRLKQALRLSRTARRGALEADCLRELGLLSQQQGNYAAALSYFEQSLQAFRGTGDRMGEGRALNTLGLVNYNMGNYATARDYCEQGLRLCRETGNRFDEAWALQHLGWTSHMQADYTAARVYYEQSLRIFRDVGNWHGELFAQFFLGRLFDDLGCHVQARACYKQTLDSDHVTGEGEGAVLGRLSLVHHHMGDGETAHRYAGRALGHYAERTGVPSGRADALTVLGHALTGLGRLDEAADAYREAVSLLRDSARRLEVVDPLAGLARVALAQGEPGQALVHAQEILRYVEDYPKLEGTLKPLRVYLTCYQVLRAHEDLRADDVLHAAHSLLQERAANIDDEALRRSYLENVAAHREIVAEFRRIHE